MRTKRLLIFSLLLTFMLCCMYIVACVKTGYCVKEVIYSNLGQDAYTYSDNPQDNHRVSQCLDFTLRHKAKRVGDNIAIFEMSFPRVMLWGSKAACTFTYSYFEYSISCGEREVIYAAQDVDVTVYMEYKNKRWQFVNVAEKP